MKRTPEYCTTARHLLGFALAAALASTAPSLSAAPVALATEPLTSTTGSNVKPNIMFILDDSGSMSWDYLPDWASDKNPFNGTGYRYLPEMHTNSGFNGVAYNPAVTYSPPVLYDAAGALDTTTYPSYSSAASWTVVKRDGFGKLSTSTDDLVGHTSYYTYVNEEYCSTVKKTDCVLATTPTSVPGYEIPAGLRWCDSAALTNCRSINDSTFKYPRYPGEAIPATARIYVTGGGQASSITVDGFQILSGTTASSWNYRTVADRIIANINNCTDATTGNCTIAGYSATRLPNTSTIVVSAPASLGNIAFTPVVVGISHTATAFSGGLLVPGSNVLTNVVSTTSTYNYPGTSSKAPTRTDCAGTSCTYAEEMTNHANWWAYYHTRMQAMKSSVSRAFKALNQRYRVGFSTICDTTATTGTNFLANDTFELAQKNNWYKKLFATGTSCWTPLRGALSKTGQYYAHRVGAVDPMQYSCQRNYAILSTDGYWNTNVETGTFGPYGLDGANVGDLDYDPATRINGIYQGPTATSNSLADVAKYYYDTDLRRSDLGNCTGASSPDGTLNVCEDNLSNSYQKQNMTTFTMGLGVDGMLNFQNDYATAASGDFYDLKNGLGSPTVVWPTPAANSATAIDDLWHAAINGHGQYFSAKNPDQIITGFKNVLDAIESIPGAGAAAATSTLNPVSGNNYAYLASYSTKAWTGNLEARTIEPDSGDVSATAKWCVENISKDFCLDANKQQIPADSGSWFCVVPDATLATCSDSGSVYNDLVTPPTCTTPIVNSCVGSMTRPPTVPAVVSATTDNRTIYTANDARTALVPFDSTFAAAHSSFFDAAHVSGLTQWATISDPVTGHTGEKLINYLRGQTGYDMNASNVDNRLYRARVTVLGDALESQPAFVAKPLFRYVYAGYPEYKLAKATRKGTVFVGANDGMLHAFVGSTSSPALTETGGRERWAYVPSMVIPNMWKLADTSYSTKHTNFVNGSPLIADICVSNCSAATENDWRTILVAGLNGGGRGYYALDITDPENPKLLWEFTTTAGNGTAKDDNLGYSYGRPVVARRASDGKWVVVVTSGYNNISPGTGLGYLFVLDAATGAKLDTYPTTAGSTTDPSGLSSVSLWDETQGGNESKFAYATDLQGNIWRFDITSPPASGSNPLKFATLKDGNGIAQPITTAPVLALVKNYRVIIVGTGKYLEVSDVSDPQTQSIYAIKDDVTTATPIGNPRTATTPEMVPQTITLSGNIRTGSKNPVDFSTDLGWYIDFPDVSTGSERVNVSPKLLLGTLLVPTIVPSSTACSPGGYGWFNYFDYSNGWPVGTDNANVSVRYESPIVGFSFIFINDEPAVLTVTAKGDFARDSAVKFSTGGLAPGFTQHRSIWRELMPTK
ncbi:MAG: hypothetical protein KKH12_12855 [Gammaproteobacteria bacterium]|nr:hypothetical protein [Gammaproteobacteria bacterium]MBU1482545.1 hypothetical protein [Gammaproteobacteria bacterium]